MAHSLCPFFNGPHNFQPEVELPGIGHTDVQTDSSSDLIRAEIENAEPILKALDARLEAVEFDPLLASCVDAASAEVVQATSHGARGR
ncbi:hypothetical protein C4Q26_23650 [Pseudomonas sp. SWI44]|nr:hypothetical protein C4Q26_23650 [Pseudomonas sp. SWI44]